MIRDREMSDHLWILAVPMRRSFKATSGERIFLGTLLAVVALIIVLATACVICPMIHPDRIKEASDGRCSI
jgi:hypothetical protein